MLTKWQRAVVGVLVLFAVGFAAAGYLVSVKAAALVPPSPETLAVWLPAGAEIRTTHEVKPGTFSVTLPLDEFRGRFPTGGPVTYPQDWKVFSSDGRTEPITIWYVQPGSAVFYKTEQRIPSPGWSRFRIGTLRAEGGAIVAYPQPHSTLDSAVAGIYFLAFVCVLGGVGFVTICRMMKKPDNPRCQSDVMVAG
ncbi:hypothetical protein HYW67_02390 [Candidatus Parcubacteria bacterium]|nr:hypothetical protein [Candidatus Parcubacteria bacterium]